MRSRYLQLAALVLASGVICPLLYLRQNFEVSMLEAFNVTNPQLGQCYSMLGVLFFVSYLPSGWLADRFSPRLLLTFSLLATGVLGIWYWTLPPFWALQIIFGAWGLTTGLTFWAALIKETNMIAGAQHQGRFFGILEGGRGVVEAALGSVVVAWFASACIFCGYALFYATYSFAGFLQTELGMTAVMAGWITAGRLWMRPIGGVLAGSPRYWPVPGGGA